MAEQRTNGHSVSRLTAHLVWSTKYRYCVLEGDIQIRCRALLIQICDAEDVQILKGGRIQRPRSYAYRISTINEFELFGKEIKRKKFTKASTRIPSVEI